MLFHPGATRPRHLVAPTFVLALGSGLGLAALGRPGLLQTLLGLYGAASAWFSLRAARDRGMPMVAATAAAFACMHLSWGLGMLAELSRCALRRRPNWRRPSERHLETA
jgi:hypothetical protein